MFCGCELSLRRAAEHAHLPGLPRPARRAAGGQRAGDPLRPDDRARARAASSRRGRSSTARTTSIPTSPKGYQISQYDEPLCRGGRLGDVRIHRVHLEEDAAKLVHVGASGRIHGSDASSSTSTAAARRSPRSSPSPTCARAEQAREWLELLRTTLRQLGVSDVNMEEGSLRCDANISHPARSGSARARHEDRAQEHELVPLHRARHPRRDRAPGGDPARRRRGRAGDAALRPAHASGSRRCAPRRRRTTTATSPSPTSCPSRSPRRCSTPRARRAARAAGRRAGALRARSGSAPTRRACSPGAPSWATTSRPRWRPTARAGPAARQLGRRRARRAHRRRGPGESNVAPAALATLVGLVGEKQVTPARPQRCSTGSCRGRRPGGDRRGRGPGAIGGGDELERRRRGRARRQPGRRREAPRRQHEGDRRDRRPRHARDEGPRRRRRGHPHRPREAGCASSNRRAEA